MYQSGDESGFATEPTERAPDLDDSDPSLKSIARRDSGKLPAQPVSAQSQVLDNEDLLDVIFRSIGDESGDTPGKSDASKTNLLWISLTCKKFFDPAMNVLWRSMKLWMPLLKMISSVVRNGPYDNTFTTNGVMVAKHFERFNFYAKRIAEFDFMTTPYSNSAEIAPHLWALLEQHRQLNNISFPRLRNLVVNMSSVPTDHIHILYLLPTLALETISLKWETATEGRVISSFLHILSLRSPKLVGLTLEGPISSDTLDLQNVHLFPRLRHLTLHFRGYQNSSTAPEIQSYWPQLTALDNLTALSIISPRVSARAQHNDGKKRKKPVKSQHQCWTFPSLQTLNVHLSSESVVHFARDFRAPNLVDMNITFNNKTDRAEDIVEQSRGEILRSLASVAGSLQSLNIEAQCRDLRFLIPSSLFTSPLLSSKLRQLMVCINLDVVELINAVGRGQRYDVLWPNLETLKLYPSPETPFKAPVLLTALKDLARAFPQLHTLSVPVSFQMTAEMLGAMRERMGLPRPYAHRSLRDLHLAPVSQPPLPADGSWNGVRRRDAHAEEHGPGGPGSAGIIDKLIVAAQYIDSVFPRLGRVEAESWYVDAEWLRGLETAVVAFQTTREGAAKVAEAWARAHAASFSQPEQCAGTRKGEGDHIGDVLVDVSPVGKEGLGGL